MTQPIDASGTPTPAPSSAPTAGPSSRRDFLTAAAAVAGAASLAGCSTTGSSAKGNARSGAIPQAAPRMPLGPDEPIRMGLIGPGGMGNGHLDAFMGIHERGEDKVQVVAVADCCTVRADDAAKKCSTKQAIEVDAYYDYRELLAREDLHGVLIASTEHWHAQMAEDALASGKDVYVEKPMTLRLDEALRLREVTRANPDMIVQVGTQFITYPRWHEAKRLIAAGAIGKPTLSQISYCRNSLTGEWLYYGIDERVIPGETIDWNEWLGYLGPRDWDPEVYFRWRRYKDFSTGIIGDLLVHEMTPMVWALGMGWPTRVAASGGHFVDKAMENHDQVMLTVDFEGEHTMIVAGSTCNATGLPTLIRGHEANLQLGGNKCVLRPEQLFVDDVDEQSFDSPNINAHDEIRRDWLKSIRTREPNVSPVEYATRVMVIVDLATRSMWGGKAWNFDPVTMEASPA